MRNIYFSPKLSLFNVNVGPNKTIGYGWFTRNWIGIEIFRLVMNMQYTTLVLCSDCFPSILFLNSILDFTYLQLVNLVYMSLFQYLWKV